MSSEFHQQRKLAVCQFAVQHLASQLSKARILVNGEMCARCWEEQAWRAAFAEDKRRREADGCYYG